jgi:endonuclease/exonuclease/phosphatase (EEP) superfamily protein YafD
MKSLFSVLAELTHALALVLAFGGFALGILAWGGVFSVKLDSLTHLAPFGLVGCIAAALIWRAGGRTSSRTGWRLALAGALAWGLLMAPEILAAALAKTSKPGRETLKIVQFNVWGTDAGNAGKLAWLRKQDPDVIVLEEVAPSGVPLLGDLAAVYPNKLTCEKRPYPCGVVILSKRPSLDEGHFSGTGPDQPNTTWGRFQGALGPYVVAATHLDWPTPDGHQQREIATLAGELRGFEARNLVLAGDFNSTPWSFSLRRMDRLSGLTRRTRSLPTWPTHRFTRLNLYAPLPAFPIDQVYAGSDWRTVKVERGPDLGSDHYPVVVTLTRG